MLLWGSTERQWWVGAGKDRTPGLGAVQPPLAPQPDGRSAGTTVGPNGGGIDLPAWGGL